MEPVPTTAILGDLLRKKRKRLGLTLAQVAKTTGVSAATLSRWERKSNADPDDNRIPEHPDFGTYERVASWLGLEAPNVSFGAEQASAEKKDTLTAIRLHLRADRNLTPQSAAFIESILETVYEREVQAKHSEEEDHKP